MLGACDLDCWADPRSEQLSAVAASEAWEKAGFPGLVNGNRYLDSGECVDDGRLAYFLLHSDHFLSRHGWKYFINFIEKNK